jgi:opacity protein-like surface antigen
MTIKTLGLLTLLCTTSLAYAEPLQYPSHFFLGINTGDSLSLQSTDLRPDYVNRGASFFIIPNNTTFQRDIGSSAIIGGFVGYQVDSNVGFSLNYDYRGNYKWEILSSLPNFGVQNEIYHTEHISIQTLLANIILTPDVNWGGFKPYVNAGIGLAVNSLGTIQNVEILNNPSFNIYVPGKRTTNFSWDAGVGADYAFTPMFHLNFGYRFVGAGKLKSSNTFINTVSNFNSTITPFKANNIFLNEFVAGLSVHFV